MLSGFELCQHMMIHGKDKHYCNLEEDHEGPHVCECGEEWNLES